MAHSLLWSVSMRGKQTIGLVVAAFLGGCVGVIGGSPGAEGEDPNGDAAAAAAAKVPQTSVEHLSAREYARSVEHLTGHVLSTGDLQLYQAGKVADEKHYVFERDSTSQGPTPGFVEGAHKLAMRIAEAVVADDAALSALLPCSPSGVEDAQCLESFVREVGRRALRRPMDDVSVEAIVASALPYATDPFPGEASDFRWAVEVALAAILEHPAFLHKVEIGEPEPGTDRLVLDDFEIASRLGFALWGSIPDDVLLDDAESGTLRTADGIEQAALRMLDDDRAREHVEGFHAQWFGFAVQDLPISDDMRAEARALIDRVVFEERRVWGDLFTLDETWINAPLAANYQLEEPTSPDASGFGWTPWDDDRGGILSMGVMLVSAGQEPSLARRGLRILDRLLCVSIDLPNMPIDTDAVNNPENGACKSDRAKAHREDGACASCHQQFDPIGQGLDAYDNMARPREFETDLVADDGIDCPVDDSGAIKLDDVEHAFSGPGQLGARIAASIDLDQCFVDRFFAFAVGRAPGDEDDQLLEQMRDTLTDGDRDFLDFLLRWVKSDAFRYRRPIAAE
jgi:hypothetical protein